MCCNLSLDCFFKRPLCRLVQSACDLTELKPLKALSHPDKVQHNAANGHAALTLLDYAANFLHLKDYH